MTISGVKRVKLGPPIVTFKGTGVALEVDLGVYSKQAIFRTCYKHTDNAFIFLGRSDEQHLVVTLHGKNPRADLATIVGNFANELIDQQVRADLSVEVGPVREIIVAQAFAEGNLLDEERDEGDYQGDPRGIGHRR